MGTTRNPGMLAITAGVGLAILFALLGATGVLDGKIGFGLAAIALVVCALVYIFYSRGNNVEKTGYGALVFIVAVAFIIPVLMVTQQQNQADAAKAQYDLKLQRGAALFGQYCATCHGFQGQGIVGPRLNGSTTLANFTNDDITRIISGGIVNNLDPTTLNKLQMPSWSQAFGGPLTEEQISYLVALIRSSDKSYLAQNNLPSVNGFSYVLGSLTNATQIAQYKDQLKSGSRPTDLVDLTSQATVTIDSINDATNASGFGWQVKGQPNAHIKIKVGTTVVWTNPASSAAHNVASGNGQPDGKFTFPKLLAPGGADSSTFTFTTAGDYPFFCLIHPAMTGYIEVVP
jgi:plastocyanin/mono/diheme cytochrome c family protein